MLYLASPYSGPSAGYRELRYWLACRAVVHLLRANRHVFSPVVHFHPMAEWGMPTTWDYWEPIDTEYMRWCDEVVVFAIPGWQQSEGVQAEIEIAKGMDKPISYLSLRDVVGTKEYTAP